MEKQLSKDIQSSSLEEIRQLKNYLQNILATVPGSLYWKNKNGMYLGCNTTMVRTAGLASPNDIIGKTDAELWPEQASALSKNDKKVMGSGKTIQVQEEVKISDGSTLYFAGVKAPLRDEQGKIIGVIGNSINITELKKTQLALQEAKEKAEAANKAKADFIDNMRHDTRTPLSCVIGLAKLLESKETNSEKKDIARAIINASESLMEFVNEVLDFSVTESGATPLKKSKFNLKQLCHELFTLMNVIATQKEILFAIDYSDTVPEFLLGDRQRLFRILMNLVSNALKFTNKGFVKLTLKINKKIKNKIILDISVIDSGIGIPAEKLDSIFQKFTRLNSSYSGTYKGSGLGLSIVKKFVHDLEGKITVKSTVNMGSEFRCLLPFDPSNQEQKHTIKNKQKTSHDSVEADAINLRFLIVEDNAIAQLLGKALIIDLGWDVEIANDAKEAWQCVSETHYDMILMDIGLPETDGIKLSKAFRKSGIKSPIVIVTAHKQQDYDELSQFNHITAFIQKPLTKEILQALAAKHIKTVSDFA
jgi:two-component system aerobic respiration control sensor histidine kinase ArcB